MHFILAIFSKKSEIYLTTLLYVNLDPLRVPEKQKTTNNKQNFGVTLKWQGIKASLEINFRAEIFVVKNYYLSIRAEKSAKTKI